MSEYFTVTISTVSLLLSCISTVVAGLTAFWVLIRRPKVQMTRPSFIAFVFDGSEQLPKVFTRSLLYCTCEPGKVVEAMFARVRQGEQQATYTFWSYDCDGRLVAGGGLFVGTQGIVTDHHFVLGTSATRPMFIAGAVAVEICARVVGENATSILSQCEFSLTSEQATVLNKRSGGVFFERSPESEAFCADIRQLPTTRRADFRMGADSLGKAASRP